MKRWRNRSWEEKLVLAEEYQELHPRNKKHWLWKKRISYGQMSYFRLKAGFTRIAEYGIEVREYWGGMRITKRTNKAS